METPDNSFSISSPRGRPTFTFSNSVDCSFRLRRGHGVRAGTPDSRKEKRHGTDDHRRQEQHRGRASPRPLHPRDRKADRQASADRHQRDQVEAHGLDQGPSSCSPSTRSARPPRRGRASSTCSTASPGGRCSCSSSPRSSRTTGPRSPTPS